LETNPKVKLLFSELKDDFNFVVLSDAPKTWIKKVLAHLEVDSYFHDNIFSGEGDVRKEFYNAFEEIVKDLKTEADNCIVIGDQEDTDILPAKKVGLKTVYVGPAEKTEADYKINNILELKNILNTI